MTAPYSPYPEETERSRSRHGKTMRTLVVCTEGPPRRGYALRRQLGASGVCQCHEMKALTGGRALRFPERSV